MTESIKLLIADDHPVVREGLISMISREPDFKVVAEANNGLEAVEKAKQYKPDVILMDLRMPEMDGVEAIRQIAEVEPDTYLKVLK